MKKVITIFGAILLALTVLTSCGDGSIESDAKKIAEHHPLLIEARKKIVINQSENFYYTKAWEYVRNEGEGSWNAVANFEKAIEINPSKAGYYNDIANSYRGGIKDYKKAIEYYNKAIEKGFNKGFVFYNRAICKVETNDLSGACSDNQTAISNGWSNDYYNIATKANCNNSSNKSSSGSDSKNPKVTFSEAEEFMQNRCNAINQTLMKKKSVNFNGTTLYMFLSVAENGYVCISSVSENALEVLAADCGPSELKIEEWNAVN
jgi:tetratricopeptide (TPR) repeat protein